MKSAKYPKIQKVAICASLFFPCMLTTLKSSETTHFTVPSVSDIDTIAVSDPASIPNDQLKLVTFKLGNVAGSTTNWSAGNKTNFYPSGWGNSNNDVQRGLGCCGHTTNIPTIQAKDKIVGMYINTVRDAGPGNISGNRNIRLNYKFPNSGRPRAWNSSTYNSNAKVAVKFDTAIPEIWVKNNDSEVFAQGALSVGDDSGNYFFITFNYFNSGGSFPERARIDESTGIFQVRVELRDNSAYVTPIGAGRFRTTTFGNFKSYGFTINRSQLASIITEANSFISDPSKKINTNLNKIEIRSVNLGIEVAEDVDRNGIRSGRGRIGAKFRNLKITTIY